MSLRKYLLPFIVFLCLPVLVFPQQTGMLHFLGNNGEILLHILPADMDSLRITLRDIDRDIDPEVVDVVEIVIVCEGDEEIETVELIETDVHTGSFRGSIPISTDIFLLQQPGEELVDRILSDLIAAYGDSKMDESTLQALEVDARQLAWTEFGIHPQTSTNELDEEGVLEVLTGQTIVCTYIDPIDGLRQENSIVIEGIVGGIAGGLSGTLAEINGIYTFAGDAFIPAGETLTIPEGTEIRFEEDYTLVLEENARLNIEGSEENPVNFTRKESFVDTLESGFTITGMLGSSLSCTILHCLT